ncbi:preprotein translocase subunit YajC [Proteinivorax hydrogeniformans]|uniref:Preprotein translocase subunit YajC n=1 Tax=Proteinivorax hydrogeniformans TaxID=1826727 RepID=A0AAU8HSR9_9FIRM
MEFLQALMPFIVLIVVFYFFLIRPQQKQQKARQAMLSELKEGDKVITIGGIFGTLTEVKEDQIKIKIADKTEIKAQRFAVEKVVE